VIVRKIMLALAAAAICTANTLTAVSARTLEVIGVDGKSVSVSLDTLERRTVVTEDRGLRVEFQGVALRDVLIKAGIPFGDALRGAALARVVIASAPDGYRVAYAIAELDAAFTDQVVLVADRRDGRPLLPDTGPLQIVAPDDKRPARWIRQVNKIEVRQLQ
jgi:Oxidoreductase molybdopterin binding domain